MQYVGEIVNTYTCRTSTLRDNKTHKTSRSAIHTDTQRHTNTYLEQNENYNQNNQITNNETT